MNVVDSCGWLEYFANGDNAGFFAPILEDTETLLVPNLTVFEVCKRVSLQHDEEAAHKAADFMAQGIPVALNAETAFRATLTWWSRGSNALTSRPPNPLIRVALRI